MLFKCIKKIMQRTCLYQLTSSLNCRCEIKSIYVLGMVTWCCVVGGRGCKPIWKERLTRDALREVLRALCRTGAAGVKAAGVVRQGRWQLRDGGELDPCSDASLRCRSSTRFEKRRLVGARLLGRPNRAEETANISYLRSIVDAYHVASKSYAHAEPLIYG